ncbi:capreomycidine synthase [Longimicrobium sp.]|uniref:capreomycidine synthase n=1 Tax=Longimicrobium sp. TaxID=2029185 RepID=UPI002B75C878|nr:capreomycidine synthase [Longimicrobium sp.]HSU14833.1 capreomycidine synthase [Longimicrobium sp.]
MQTFPPALLEEWMRLYYFAVDADIGSSGVSDYSLAEVRALLGIGVEEMDAVVFHDSQTLGGPGVRRAAARRWAGGEVDRVMVTHGSTEAIFLLLNALLRPGDEVVVLDPVYPGLGDVVRAIGCRLVPWTLRPGNGWRPDLDELEDVVSPRTRMIVVNFPHNPTGATLTPGEQDALLAVAARAGAWLLWDGAFAELTYDAPPLPDPSGRYERAVSLGTLSKAYGLPGLRVGWCLAAPEVLERMTRVRDYTTLHLSPLVELIAERVIDGADRILEQKRAVARRNRRTVQRWMDEQGGAITWTLPAGGVCGFPRLHEVPDVEAFCHALAREQRVMLVPGTCFGWPGHARLGFGGSAGALEEGLGRLAEALRAAAAPALV